MAAKAAAVEPQEKPEPKDPLAPVAQGVFDEGGLKGLRWQDHRVFGELFRLREYTTGEEDEAWDAAENPDGETVNERIRRRFLLSTSIVSPVVTADDVTAWPSLKTRMLLVIMDRLNGLPPADAEGNA